MQKHQQASSKKSPKLDKAEAIRLCDDFLTDVEEVMASGADDNAINVAIERAYDKYIFNNKAGITKSYFLGYLWAECSGNPRGCDERIFDRVVDHLFTPMAWSELTIQKHYGIKNTTTGRLVTLMRNESEESGADFLLVECIDQPDLSPMLVRDRDAAEKFITILNRPSTSTSYDSSSDPVDSGKVVHLDLDENINTGNLEVVEVELLFK